MDFEQFNALLEAASGIISPLSPEHCPWSITSLQRGDLGLQVLCEGGANSYQGETPEDRVSLAVTLPTPLNLRVNGFDLKPGRLIVLHPGEEATSYNADVTRYATLTIPIKRFEELVERFDPAQTERLMGGSINLDIGVERWQTITDLLGALSRSHWPIAAASQRALLENISEAFVGAAASSSPRPKAPWRGERGAAWRRVVSSMREFLNEPSLHGYSVAELARYTGVSERTMRDIVKAAFGLSPKQLIMARQLRDIRLALQHPRTGDTVSSIATRYGFWELGRFAGRYRQVYGETPSVTLATAHSSAAGVGQLTMLKNANGPRS